MRSLCSGWALQIFYGLSQQYYIGPETWKGQKAAGICMQFYPHQKKKLHAGALDFLPFLFERNGQVNREKGQGSCTRCAVVSWSGHPLQKQR